MEDAFDTFRNQRIYATPTTVARFPGHLICPKCKTDVTLAYGDLVRAHFRHLRGTDHDDCERYSKYFRREVAFSQYEDDCLDAVLIAKQVQENEKNRVNFWVRFRPKKTASNEKLAGQVDFKAGEKTIRIEIQPTLRQQYFRITSPESNYLILAKLLNGASVPYHIEGFDKSAVVFRNTEGEAVRIQRQRSSDDEKRSLKPGGYVVVSRESLIGRFHLSLGATTLGTISGLHAALITIPENPKSEVRKNIRNLLEFEITEKKVTYGFHSPTNVRELDLDRWEVSKDDEVKICVRIKDEYRPMYTRLILQRRILGELRSDYLNIQGKGSEVVVCLKSGTSDSDILRIGLTNNADNLPQEIVLEINLSDDVIEPECARIQFEFSSNTNTSIRVKWSSHLLPWLLAQALRGNRKLLAVTGIPKSVELKLSDARGQLVRVDGVQIETTLREFSQNYRFPVVLEASGHGRLFIDGGKMNSGKQTDESKVFDLVPRCRYEARLLDAFKRGQVSSYAFREIQYE